MWDYYGICTFESLKLNEDIDKNDVIAIKMIEKRDLIDYCRSTFYDLVKSDKVAAKEILGEFKLKGIKYIPSLREDETELNKYRGFEEYIDLINTAGLYRIHTQKTMLRIGDSDFESFFDEHEKEFDVYVSYVWNKHKIFTIIKLERDGFERVKSDKLWNKMIKTVIKKKT